MSDKYYVGADLIASNNNGKYKPVSRVTLVVDDDNVITAGDDTGFELTANCPHATQQMADALLQKLRGYVYQAFKADEANLNPSAELGDGVTAGGLYGVISKIRDDGSGYVGISAPGTAELEDEYPMDGPLSRMVSRQIAGVRSAITKTEEKIRLEIKNEVDGLSSSIDLELEQIRLEVQGAEDAISYLELDLDGISARIEDAEGNISNLELTTEDFNVRISDAEGGISELELTASAFGIRIDAAEGAISYLELGLEGLSTRIEDVEGNVSELQLTTEDFSVRISDAEGSVAEIYLTIGGFTVVDDDGETKIKGGSIETDSISANALHLGGMLAVYKEVFGDTAGGYLGYDSGFLGKTGGIGIRSSNEFSQMVCTDIAARLSYSDDGRHVTQVVCGQELALSSVTSIQFSVGGNVNAVVAGIDEEAFYPANSSLTIGTSQYRWADVYAAGTSMSDLLGRVKALEQATKS